MSLRSVLLALTPFRVELSHMSVWRDLQEQADLLEQRRHWHAVRILGGKHAKKIISDSKRSRNFTKKCPNEGRGTFSNVECVMYN